jgi:hypothetical protein
MRTASPEIPGPGARSVFAYSANIRRNSSSPIADVSRGDGLERHADPHSALPDDPAALLRGAVEHFEPFREIDELFQMQARAARRVVDEDALDRGRFRPDEYFGLAGDPTSGPLT